MHSIAVCLLLITLLAVCYGAPNNFKVLRARAHYPLRRERPAVEYPVAKRSRVPVDIDACVKAHNEKRAEHDAPPLKWDDGLAKEAQEWADHLANDVGHMEHAGPIKARGEGENLYWSESSSIASCKDAVEAWYSEEADYDFNYPPKTFSEFFGPKQIGHFTQEVWKATKSVGVAIATRKAPNGMTDTFIVGRYQPQGNILGLFGANVGRPHK